MWYKLNPIRQHERQINMLLWCFLFKDRSPGSQSGGGDAAARSVVMAVRSSRLQFFEEVKNLKKMDDAWTDPLLSSSNIGVFSIVIFPQS